MLILLTILVWLVILASSAAASPWGTTPSGQQQPSPNIVLINLDDASRNQVEIDFFRNQQTNFFLPNIRRLALEGTRFTNCHCAIPFCNPSRLCLMTGQYAFQTRVRGNFDNSLDSRGTQGGYLPITQQGAYGRTDRPYLQNELGTWLRSQGYYTIHVGKYYHADFVPGPGERWSHLTPPGWEDFFAVMGNSYFFPFIRHNGQPVELNELDPELFPNLYRTDIESTFCLEFIKAHRDRADSRPFFLYYAPIAPHTERNTEFDPTEQTPFRGMVDNRFKNFYPNLKQVRPPSFDELDISDKPAPVRDLRPLTFEGSSWWNNQYLLFDLEYRRRVLAIRSVDQFIARLRQTLAQLGELDNTIILLTSDNGYLLGEHRLQDKRVPYQESSQVPLIVWGPGLGVQPSQTATHLVSQIDVAPTLLEIAGAGVPSEVQGKSFLPILTGEAAGTPASWRPEGILVEGWGRSQAYLGQNATWTFVSLRMFESVYTEWASGEKEFYRLTTDPFELRNRYSQLPPAAQNNLATRIGLARSDMVEPEIFFDNPLDANQMFFQDVTLSGLAEFKTDIEAVHLQITSQAGSTTLFWNGALWGLTPQTVNAELAATDSLITDWHYSFTPGTSGVRRFAVTGWAVAAGSGATSPLKRREFSVDSTQPYCQLSSPRAGEIGRTAEGLILSGFAHDDAGIRRVRLAIRRNDTLQFWNGTDWQSGSFQLEANLSTPGGVRPNWTYRFTPPEHSGAATVFIRPATTDGRFDPVPLSVDFRWAR